jgi:predicted nuclease with TOPRIM domain
MNDNEMLQVILQEIKGVSEKVDNLEQRFDNLEQRFGILESRVDRLEKNQLSTQITLETIVEKCIDVLGEGYQATYEKIDRLPITSMNSKITQIELLTKINANDIQQLKQKVG